jgi:hypothetical protein
MKAMRVRPFTWPTMRRRRRFSKVQSRKVRRSYIEAGILRISVLDCGHEIANLRHEPAPEWVRCMMCKETR